MRKPPVAKPPKTYDDFVKRHPGLGQAWQALREAEKAGPLDEKTRRLVKLGVAIGAFHTGAVHSAVRKALSAGVGREEIEHVVALAAGTIGLPSAVAVDTWIQEQLR
jgi:4-carboxymuconolactone decarboxylase